jgi:hypothetical protein
MQLFERTHFDVTAARFDCVLAQAAPQPPWQSRTEVILGSMANLAAFVFLGACAYGLIVGIIMLVAKPDPQTKNLARYEGVVNVLMLPAWGGLAWLVWGVVGFLSWPLWLQCLLGLIGFGAAMLIALSAHKGLTGFWP